MGCTALHVALVISLIGGKISEFTGNTPDVAQFGEYLR
jgi:hypothetical protein